MVNSGVVFCVLEIISNQSSQSHKTNTTDVIDKVKFFYLQLHFLLSSCYTSKTALIQPSFSGLFVTCAYLPMK